MIRLPKVKPINAIAFIEVALKLILAVSALSSSVDVSNALFEAICNWTKTNDVWISAVCAALKLRFEWSGTKNS